MRPVNAKFAKKSSGSIVPIETKLLVALRILAGASYLDMIWYGVPINHVDTYLFEMLPIMNKCPCLQSIRVPETAAEIKKCAREWTSIQIMIIF
jgi:hypothetical protein